MFRAARLASRLAPVVSRTRLRATTRCYTTGSNTEDAKALYAIGFNIGRQLADLKPLTADELDSVLSGVRSSVLGEPPKVPVDMYVQRGAEIIKGKKAVVAELAASAGLTALAAAAAEPGATQTASGLVYKELEGGDGASPTKADKVKVHYEGKLVDGTVFDSSIARGEPIEFPLSGVIPGWTEGLQLMKVGGKARLTIPSDIAYGDNGTGPIPPKATLIVEVHLLDIV